MHARKQLDEQLRRLADGDRSAFEPAYAALWPLVRAFCRRMLAPADAEDAAQRALLKVFDRAASFDPSRAALPWVLAIAAWECRTIRKQHARAREVELPAQERIDEGASPEARLIEAELEAAATSLLGALSEADRETLRATMSEERPAALDAATFRKRRERAVGRLREVWRRVYGS